MTNARRCFWTSALGSVLKRLLLAPVFLTTHALFTFPPSPPQRVLSCLQPNDFSEFSPIIYRYQLKQRNLSLPCLTLCVHNNKNVHSCIPFSIKLEICWKFLATFFLDPQLGHCDLFLSAHV